MVKFKVYEMMAKRGFHTRKALAEVAGLTEANLGKIVKGNVARVEVNTVNALCRALDCQPGDLFEYVPDAEVKPTKKARRSA